MPKSADLRLLETLWRQPVLRTVLPNGVTLLVQASAAAPVASVQVWVRSGSIHEGASLGSGLSHYLEHLLFKGTARRAGREISATIQAHGGLINAYTTFDRTVYHVDLPSAHAGVALDVLADLVLRSTLPADEVEKEREVILREIAMTRDSPDNRLGEALFATAFREHPYRFPIIGHRDAFAAVSRAELVDYYRARYIPDNLVVIVAGDVDPAEIQAAVETHFGAAPRVRCAPANVPAEPAQLAPRALHLFEDVELTRAGLAWPVPGLTHPDAPALDVLAALLGQGDSSVLWLAIREKARLVHSIDAHCWTPRDAGLFYLSYTCDPAKREAAAGAGPGLHRRANPQGRAAGRRGGDRFAQNGGWPRGPFGRGGSRGGRSSLRRILVPAPHPDHAQGFAPGSAGLSGRGDVDRDIPQPGGGSAGRFAGLGRSRGAARFHGRDSPQWRAPVAPARCDPAQPAPAGFLRRRSLARAAGPAGRLRAPRDHVDPRHQAAVRRRGGGLHRGCGRQLLPVCGQQQFRSRCRGPAGRFRSRDLPARRGAARPGLHRRIVRDRARRAGRGIAGGGGRCGDPWAKNPAGEILRRPSAGARRARHGRGPRCPGRGRSRRALASVGLPAGGPLPAGPVFGTPAQVGDFVEIQPREQAVVFQAFPGPGLLDPDFYAAEVADELFSGMSSRLFERVREEKGLAYFVRSGRVAGVRAGMFYFYAGTAPGKEHEVLAEIDAEIARVQSGGVAPEELRRCQTRLKAARVMAMQTNSARAMQAGLNAIYGLPVDDWKQHDGRIDAVTAEILADFARRRFQRAHRTQLIVRP
jgi:predicted Zn-dependent peptidase